MNNPYQKISDILKKCESTIPECKYDEDPNTYREKQSPYFKLMLPEITKPVEYNSGEDEIYVVSDLHIAAGRNKKGVYKGTENFFADEPFYRFLEYARRDGVKKAENAVLIINGDVFDFIRIVDYPGRVRKIRLSKRFKSWWKHMKLEKPKVQTEEREKEFLEWQNEIFKVGIEKSLEELKNCISKREEDFGLKTDHYKTIYKLNKIKNGHSKFFDALALWISKGNRIILVKGNHDLELWWPEVRNYIRLILAEKINSLPRFLGGDGDLKNLENILVNNVLPNLKFIDDSVLINKDFYVEHGHRYDKVTMVLDSPVFGKTSSEINIPFGSFFNRYIINKVELFLPFFDNLRPQGNMLSILFKENTALALKLLLRYVPFTIKILLKHHFRYVWFMFGRVALFVLLMLIPIGVLVYFLIKYSINIFDPPQLIQNDPFGLGLNEKLFDALKWVGSALLSYLLARMSAWFQLSEPDSLDRFAKMRLDANPDYRIITMGHTHNPGTYIFSGGKRFYNTGTWIPVIETSTAEVREDKTYTFLHLIPDKEDKKKLIPAEDGLLQR